MLTVRELRDILENVPDHKRIILKVGYGYYEVTGTWYTGEQLIIESR